MRDADGFWRPSFLRLYIFTFLRPRDCAYFKLNSCMCLYHCGISLGGVQEGMVSIRTESPFWDASRSFPKLQFFAKSNSSFLRECGIALHKAPKASLMVILQQINMAGSIIRIYYQVKLATNQHSSIRVRTGWQFVLSARIDTIFATAINLAELCTCFLVLSYAGCNLQTYIQIYINIS